MVLDSRGARDAEVGGGNPATLVAFAVIGAGAPDGWVARGGGTRRLPRLAAFFTAGFLAGLTTSFFAGLTTSFFVAEAARFFALTGFLATDFFAVVFADGLVPPRTRPGFATETERRPPARDFDMDADSITAPAPDARAHLVYRDPMTRLVLHADSGWISPWVFTSFVALKEKGLEFEVTPVSLEDGEQRLPYFRDPSITARVPALQHDDFWVAESMAIVDYLDEAFPGSPRALPADLRDRARARQVLSWLRSDLSVLREERSTDTMFHERATKQLSPAAADAAEKLLRVADTLVPAERSTLAKEGFSVADADLAFMLHRLILNDHELPPRLRAYAEAHWERPSIRAFVERTRPSA